MYSQANQIMLRFLYLLFNITLYLSAPLILAQNTIDDKAVYGLNPLLYNGKVYNYFPGTRVKGHQYINQKDYSEGSLTIRGVKYKKLLLNYDILNQEVILKYVDPQGSNRLLTVSKAWLEKFSIGQQNFSLIETPDNQKLIVQTLNQGDFQLHNNWTKKLIANISFVSEHYLFDEKNSTLYLSYRNILHEYNSTKDILKLLNNKDQQKVKLYIKQNKIKARTNSLDQLKGLLNYCNQLDL